MYYLRKGQVELNVSGSGLCKVLDHGDNFGEEEFFRKIARNHTAEAKSFAKMWRISYKNFSAVLRRYPYLNVSIQIIIATV
jgi:CRP-like cAMP-binding protein